jgi:hypothetical protein
MILISRVIVANSAVLLFAEEEGEWCPVYLQAAVVIDEAHLSEPLLA